MLLAPTSFLLLLLAPASFVVVAVVVYDGEGPLVVAALTTAFAKDFFFNLPLLLLLSL